MQQQLRGHVTREVACHNDAPVIAAPLKVVEQLLTARRVAVGTDRKQKQRSVGTEAGFGMGVAAR